MPLSLARAENCRPDQAPKAPKPAPKGLRAIFLKERRPPHAPAPVFRSSRGLFERSALP